MFNLTTFSTNCRHILLKPSRLRKFTGDHENKAAYVNGPRNARSTSDSKKYIGLSSIIPIIGLYYYFTWDNRKALSQHVSNKSQHNPGDFVEGLKVYSAEEVSKHNDKAIGVWVTYKRGVYDITDFIEKHPGGPDKIIMAAGGSIEPFWMVLSVHKRRDVYDLLESMRIGNISETDSPEIEMDDPYANEPSRNKILIINNKKPFNAETPASLLVESYHTASDLFYVRNHLPVPEVDPKTYELELLAENNAKKILKLEDIKKYPKYTVNSTIMCAGNRRSEMAQVKPVQGLSWGIGAVGNATWSGARLRDLLMDLNINEEDYNHVQFEGLDLDPSGAPYSTSIPIRKAMDPRGDVLLAYEMNGEPLPRDHGFPIRVVVPGVVGARNVKWLGKIVVSKHESDSPWQQRDYKGFSPSTDWSKIDYSKSPAIQELPVISAICIPRPEDKVEVKNGKITVKGYAWSGGGQKIIRVDVTTDRGTTWETADFVAQDSAQPGSHWGWTIWQAELPVKNDQTEVEIWSKAVDSSYNVQPECSQHIWNLRGVLNNSYHRVAVEIKA